MRTSVATTRGLVLDAVRESQQVSRVELAEITGLTQATISTVVRGLLDEGLLVESGAREFTGGKPRIKLMLNPRSRCAVGVQLAADWITVCIVDAAGAIAARTRVPGVGGQEATAVVERVARHVRGLIDLAGLDSEAIVGAGLALPGVVDLAAGRILTSRSLPQLQDFPVRDALAQSTGLDVSIDNNAAAAAIGEYWSGGVGEARAHCTIYMGANIGVGVILAGSVYRGASGNVGGIGPLRVVAPGWEDAPSVEELAGPRGVAARARMALARGRSSDIRLPETDRDPFLDFTAVATAAIAGDPLAVALIEDSAEHLAAATLSVANLLDLDAIVLAGPSFTIAGSIYLDVLRRRLAAAFYARARHGVSVALSAQVADAAAVGAAAGMLQQELSPRSLGAVGVRA